MSKEEITTTKTVETEIDPYEDRVIINIPPPTEDDEDGRFYISVNNYNAYIQYGEDVPVPRFVKHMLENKKMCAIDAKKNAKRFVSKDKQ